MDTVFIEKLKVLASIGVWEWEHRIKQNLTIDIELGCDIRKAAKTDDIACAISYKDVATKVCERIENSKFKLIETVAETIAQLLLQEFDVQWCKVKVSKPRAVEKASNVGVIIERTADDTNNDMSAKE